MTVIKYDFNKNHLRVVEKFAYIRKIFLAETNSCEWILFCKYYELQLDSYWGKGWLKMEQSFNEHEWDFRWSDNYLSHWQQSPKEIEKIKIKYPPKYKNS